MVYAYSCNDCSHSYEETKKLAEMDKISTCPNCDNNNTRRVIGTPRFKTSGGGHGRGWDGKGQMK